MPNVQGIEALRVTVKTPKGDRTFFPVMSVSVDAEANMISLTWEDNTAAPKLMQESFASGQWSGFTVEP